MRSVTPEYVIPTFGIYVLDLATWDGRTVQVGGTLPISETLGSYITALYLKCYDSEEISPDAPIVYIKIDIPPAYKVIIENSGSRELTSEGLKFGIPHAYMVKSSQPYDYEYSPQENEALFSASGYLIKEYLIAHLELGRHKFTVEKSIQPNKTPFDFIQN